MTVTHGTAVARVLTALESAGASPRQHGEAYTFFCPVHQDGHNQAGELRQGDKGALVTCHAGCDRTAVVAAIGLTMADLFDEEPTARVDWNNPDARYVYRDVDGGYLYEVRRVGFGKDKQIRPFMGSGPGAKMGLPPGVRVPYRLPEVVAAVAGELDVLVCEGERDADAASALGLAATTNVGGAVKWRGEYNAYFAGASVIVVRHKDEPGRAHARQVVENLSGVAASVRVVEAVTGNDLCDHLAAGHGVEELLLCDLAAEASAPVQEAPGAPATTNGQGTLDQAKPATTTVVTPTRLAVREGAERSRIDGARFILDAPETVPVVWGKDDQVAWSAGEPLLINGPSGVGKTTIAQQVALARLGLRSEVLGMEVKVDGRRVLYIAADRPPQAARSMRRMVSEEDRAVLAEMLVVWRGPLPYDLASNTEVLAAMCEEFDAGTLIIDSLKDVAAKLSEDETGNKVNQALQLTCLAGSQAMALHHQRKRGQGLGKPKSLDDVYGSTWLTAGAGSVLLVWGEAGDAVVELSHLKQPADAIGPLTLLHDHSQGLTTVQGEVNLLTVVRFSSGITAEGAARALFSAEAPDANQVQRARRRLDKLCKDGLVYRVDSEHGGAGGGTNAARFYATTDREDDGS